MKQFHKLRKRGDQIFYSLGKEEMILKNIEKIQLSLGDQLFFAKKDIKKGELFSEKNLKNLRPVVGITSDKFFQIIGKKSKRNIKKDSPIKKNYL